MDFYCNILGIIQLILSIYCFIYEFRRGSISAFIWAGLLVVFHIPHLVSSINFGTQYQTETYASASLFSIVFMLIYIITKVILRRRNPDTDVLKSLQFQDDDETIYTHKFEKYFYQIIIITTTVMAEYIVSATGSLLGSSWGAILHGSTSNRALSILFTVIPFFVDAAGGIFIYYWFKKGKIEKLKLRHWLSLFRLRLQDIL